MSYKEYRSHPFISQSDLKGKGDLDDSPSIRRGNLVDCLITTPEDFKKDFEVVESLPTPGIKNVVDHFYDRWDSMQNDLLLYKEEIMSVVEDTNFGNGKYDWDRITKELKKGSQEYFDKLVETNGKTLITNDTYEEAKRMAKIVKEHDFTKEFFNNDYKKEYQVELYNENFHGLGVKGLVDMKLTDEVSRTYIDLKTIYDHHEWLKHFFKYRYDIQLPFYADIDLDDRILNKLIYIFVDPIHDYPIVYEMDEVSIENARNGSNKYIVGYLNGNIDLPVVQYLKTPRKGYIQMIEDYKFYQTFPELKGVPTYMLKTNGRVFTNDF